VAEEEGGLAEVVQGDEQRVAEERGSEQGNVVVGRKMTNTSMPVMGRKQRPAAAATKGLATLRMTAVRVKGMMMPL